LIISLVLDNLHIHPPLSKMSEKYEQEQQVEERAARKPGFGQKAKRHCARFWWVHLIIFCVVFLIIALCLVYAGMPRIAQHDVDKSSLEFTELQFLDPTPNSLVLTQRSNLRNPSRFTPT
jgi:cytoskeletal protein RodZ